MTAKTGLLLTLEVTLNTLKLLGNFLQTLRMSGSYVIIQRLWERSLKSTILTLVLMST